MWDYTTAALKGGFMCRDKDGSRPKGSVNYPPDDGYPIRRIPAGASPPRPVRLLLGTVDRLVVVASFALRVPTQEDTNEPGTLSPRYELTCHCLHLTAQGRWPTRLVADPVLHSARHHHRSWHGQSGSGILLGQECNERD